MSVTFLYTILLGIIYLLKKNWKTFHSRRRQDYFARDKKRLHGAIHREPSARVAMESKEENTRLRKVVAELT